MSIRRSSVFHIIQQRPPSEVFEEATRARADRVEPRANRLQRARMLLKMHPDDQVNFMWFTDEKLFTVAAPKNPQNDRLYVPVPTTEKEVAPERLLRTRPTFSQSPTVSFGISKLGCTDLVFVDPSDQRRTLPRRAAVKAATTHDARGISRILRLSTGQRPYTLGTRHCDFSSRKRWRSFHHRSRRRGAGGGHVPPLNSGKNISDNFYVKFGHFSGKNHVKLGNFVNFSGKYHKIRVFW